ncbi:MAG: hypothetical protein MJ246_07095 [Clostridia bacterium]|nr:hypothetical protein [Clostridia bacterium]
MNDESLNCLVETLVPIDNPKSGSLNSTSIVPLSSTISFSLILMFVLIATFLNVSKNHSTS